VPVCHGPLPFTYLLDLFNIYPRVLSQLCSLVFSKVSFSLGQILASGTACTVNDVGCTVFPLTPPTATQWKEENHCTCWESNPSHPALSIHDFNSLLGFDDKMLWWLLWYECTWGLEFQCSCRWWQTHRLALVQAISHTSFSQHPASYCFHVDELGPHGPCCLAVPRKTD
jgi:hypothetical protein